MMRAGVIAGIFRNHPGDVWNERTTVKDLDSIEYFF